MRHLILIMLALAGAATCTSVRGQGKLWGMTTTGGPQSGGVIFTTNADGSGYHVEHAFSIDVPGSAPYYTRLTEANGKLYGVTSAGGQFGGGVLFELNPVNNAFTALHHFDELTGWTPTGSLTLAPNGKLYGMTSAGGTCGSGVVFEFDLSNNTYTNEHDFCAAEGAYPQGGFSLFNGKLYGVTFAGGMFASGNILSFDPATSNVTLEYSFDYIINGAYPICDLLFASDSLFYGVTPYGGLNGLGTLFSYDPNTGDVQKKRDFDADTGGAPYGSLVQSGQSLFGAAYLGGADTHGVLFEYAMSTGVYTNRHNFSDVDGIFPFAGLALASNGTLFGMCSSGGASSAGTIYSYNPSTGIFTKRVDFIPGTSGGSPYGSFVSASDGKLYAMASMGGAYSNGTVFSYDPVALTFSKRIDFGASINGAWPSAPLVASNNGKLYGTTTIGGTKGGGVLFEFTPGTGAYVIKRSLSKTMDCNTCPLTVATSKKLYGIGKGNVFQFDLQTGDTTRWTIPENGSAALGNHLTKAADGHFYGLVNTGGTPKNQGALIDFNPSSGVTIRYRFDAQTSGKSPSGGLTLASNGKLYGTVDHGVVHNQGALFEFDASTGIVTQKVVFGNQNSSWPQGSMVRAANDKLYGTTSVDSTNTEYIFEYDPANDQFTANSFQPSSDGYAFWDLASSSDSYLYVLTSNGGTNSQGSMSRYDPVNHVLTPVASMAMATGTYPLNTSLAYREDKNPQSITFNAISPKTYGIPPFLPGASASSGLPVTYVSSDTTVAIAHVDTVYVLRAGVVTLTATQVGDASYYPADEVSQLLTINKGTPVVTWTDPDTISYGVALDSVQLNATASVPGVFTYTPAAGTILNAGNQPLSVNFTPTDVIDYNSVNNVVVHVAVIHGHQTITFPAIPTRAVNEPPFSLTATATSDLPVRYTSTSKNIKIEGSLVTMFSTGSVTVMAHQDGNIFFDAADSVGQTFCISPPKPTITVHLLTLTSSAAVGNQWFMNGTPVADSVARTFVVADPGSYTVQASQNGCSSPQSDPIVIAITGDISAYAAPSVYPNPAADFIDIQGIPAVTDASVFDAVGHQSTLALENRGTSYRAYLHNLVPGLYLVNVTSGNRIHRIKFIKK